jgi:hypothetical protein
MMLMLILSVVVMAVSACPSEELPYCPQIDLCDFGNPGHPAAECLSRMPALMRDSITSDCIATRGTLQFDNFKQNILNVCAAKGFELANCCDPCNFAGQGCYDAMTTLMQKQVLADCRAAANPDDFVAMLSDVCTGKGEDALESCPPPPACEEITVCDLTNPDHPTNECYMALTQLMQIAVMTDCARLVDTPAFEAFYENILSVCEAKGAPGGYPEPCPCDPCDFSGQSCYDNMVPRLQDQVTADCCAVAGTPGYSILLAQLSDVCSGKNEAGIVDPCAE